MISPFGIEHGEISKGKIPKKVMVPQTKAQKATKGRGGPSGPEKVRGALHRIGGADISLKGVGTAAGRVAGATGRFFERRPGLTGTALVGGGGAAGYKYLKKEEKK